MRASILVVSLSLSLGVSQVAQAVLTTNPAGILNPVVVDFNGFGVDNRANNASVGSGVTWTAAPIACSNPPDCDATSDDLFASPDGKSILGSTSSNYGLGNNGFWTPGHSGYSGLDSFDGSMTYSLDGPTRAIGGFMNYVPNTTAQGWPYGGVPVIIAALDSASNVLESWDLKTLAPISTTGDDQGAFRGITRPTADIWGFRVSGNFVVLDDLRFSSIPEPMTAMLVGVGLTGMIASRRRSLKA